MQPTERASILGMEAPAYQEVGNSTPYVSDSWEGRYKLIMAFIKKSFALLKVE